MSRGGGRCCWKLVQASAKGLRCCSVSIAHRTGRNKELSGPKRQVSCVCFFFDFAGSALLQGHSSSCGEQGLLSSYRAGLLTAVASLEEHRLWVLGLQALQLLGSRAQAQWLWCMGLVLPWHVIFLNQGQT